MLISFGIRSDPIGPDYNSDPICYRVRLNEIGSELIFGSDWKKSDPITQKPVNIQNYYGRKQLLAIFPPFFSK